MKDLDSYSLLNDLELKFDLSKFFIDEYWIYPIIKQSFFAPGIYHLNPDREKIHKSMNTTLQLTKNMLSGLYWSLKNSPPKYYDIIISDNTSSRMKVINGYHYSIWMDFLYDLFPDKNILTFERPSQTDPKHYRNIKSRNIYHADLLIQKLLLKSKISQKKIRLDVDPIKELFDFLNLEFNRTLLEDKLRKFFAYIDLYQRFFRRALPKLIVIKSSYEYSVMAMISVCKKMNIKTVEMQHGIIYETHYGYIYKQVQDYLLFPDYFFSYGKYFTELLKRESKLFKKKSILTAGFPFIEQVKCSPIDLNKDIIEYRKDHDIIYITSQWTIRHELAKFCITLAQILPDKFRIIYKTHPRERLNEDFYRKFSDIHNIYLISDSEISSLELMKISKIHTTIYSTSLFESLYFGLPNILINHSIFSQNIKSFVDNETVYLVDNTQSYLEVLNHISKHYDDIQRSVSAFADKFFTSNSLEKISEMINRLLINKED
jgi:hypothetical protein